MSQHRDYYGKSPETILVGLARNGDRKAFAELVRKRQVWIRTLMRRCCRDTTLANDLSQQVFVQAWQSIGQLRRGNRFAPWLKRLAVNTWLQHLRKKDPLRDAEEYADVTVAKQDSTGIAMDLDAALATLPDQVRLCVVLSYHERMTHDEIAALANLPLGTVKSHIRRGSQRLRELLSAYQESNYEGESQ